MKKILIVIPAFGLGGTISSLYNFLEAIKHDNQNCSDIYLFSMENSGVSSFYFDKFKKIEKSLLLDMWFSSFKNLNILEKILYAPFKILKRLLLKLNIKPLGLIYKLSSQSSKFQGFDKVIAFQEGIATDYACHIHASEHYAWVHCNLQYSSINAKKDLKTYSKYDKIISVSSYTNSVSKEFFPSLSDRCEYIYNVIDMNKILEKSLEQDKDLDGLSDDDLLIISVGRLDPIKQFSLIPEIASNLNNQNRRIVWYIIGRGSVIEDEKIKKEIENKNVSSIVKCLGYKSNPYPFFKRANLYVCTSKSEACPMVFLEANALGTYVISNGFPSAKEFLKPGIGEIQQCTSIASRINQIVEGGMPPVIRNEEFFVSSIKKFIKILN